MVFIKNLRQESLDNRIKKPKGYVLHDFSISSVKNGYTIHGVYPSGSSPSSREFFANLATDRDDTKELRLADSYRIAAEASASVNETNARMCGHHYSFISGHNANIAGKVSTGTFTCYCYHLWIFFC